MNQYETLEDVLLEEQIVSEQELILLNDEVNTFEHVIKSLVDVCKHHPLQAEQCAYIVHFNGQCGVKKGAFEALLPFKDALQMRGLTVEIN